MFVNFWLPKMTPDRSLLSDMGVNMSEVTKIGKHKRGIINVLSTAEYFREIKTGIVRDSLDAYNELLYGGKLKPYIIMRGVVRVRDNRYCPMKTRRVLMESPDKKETLCQRIDLIINHLTTTGTLYNL